MRAALGGLVIAVMLMPAAAWADIRIDESTYEAGVLVIRGRTAQPDQVITLDQRFEEHSNAERRFVFRVTYRPHLCEVELRAGADVKSLKVDNCETEAKVPVLKPDLKK